jgi:hypothetical protein
MFHNNKLTKKLLEESYRAHQVPKIDGLKRDHGAIGAIKLIHFPRLSVEFLVASCSSFSTFLKSKITILASLWH